MLTDISALEVIVSYRHFGILALFGHADAKYDDECYALILHAFSHVQFITVIYD